MKIVVTSNDIKLRGVAAGLFLSRAFCGENLSNQAAFPRKEVALRWRLVLLPVSWRYGQCL